MPYGILAVSPWTISIASIGTPRWSATSCAKVVSCPWPCACDPVSTVTLPVGCTRTAADFEQAGARAERADHGRRRDAAGLDIGGDADAAILAAVRGFLAARLEAGVIGRVQRHLQRRLIVAAVVLQRDRRLVREGVGRDEVAAAQFGRVDPQFVGREIDDALQQERRLGPAGAAIGIDRHGVGEHRLGLDIDRRGRVGAGEQRAVQIGRDAGREGRQIGAHIGDRRDLQRGEFRRPRRAPARHA